MNTSEEPQKGGVENDEEAIELARYIINECPALQLAGFMTIGEQLMMALGLEASFIPVPLGGASGVSLIIAVGSVVGSSNNRCMTGDATRGMLTTCVWLPCFDCAKCRKAW